MKKIVLYVWVLCCCIACRQSSDILSEFWTNTQQYQVLQHDKSPEHAFHDVYLLQVKKTQDIAFLAQMTLDYADDAAYFKAQMAEKFKVDFTDDDRVYVKDFKIKNSYCAVSSCLVSVLYSPRQERLYIEFLKL